MGGGYSDLNIYLNSRIPINSIKVYNVSTTQENFKGCSDFQVITHKIEFNPSEIGRNYNVLLYDGYDDIHQGDFVFGYYYPGNDNEVIKHVKTYYSILAPDDPLVISFHTKTNIYNCYFHDLKNARWDYGYNIDIYSFGSYINKNCLEEAFRKISRNRKIKVETGKSKEISSSEQLLGGPLFRYIIKPKGNESILGIESIFSIGSLNLSSQMANNLDQYYLHSFMGKLYEGIIVYYYRERYNSEKENTYTALLLEFIDTTKPKMWLQRKDENGYWWDEEKVTYDDDKQLVSKLKQIYKKAEETKVVTIILDENRKYEGLDKFEVDNKNKAYNIRKYTFNSPNKPIFLYERQKCEICNLKTEDQQTKKVDVYYLKTTSGDDLEPFLIVLFENGNEPQKIKKAFYFNDEYKFKNWHEVGEEGKIEEKIKKIEQYAGCITQLGLLRWYAFQILTGKDPSQEEIKKKEENQRPPVIKPPDKDEGLPINWIIGGSVGGGVFVISSAALYGVYWYNTTIKLLT